MLETTSLRDGRCPTFELFTRSRDISAETFRRSPVPCRFVWYLLAPRSSWWVSTSSEAFARGIGAQPEKRSRWPLSPVPFRSLLEADEEWRNQTAIHEAGDEGRETVPDERHTPCAGGPGVSKELRLGAGYSRASLPHRQARRGRIASSARAGEQSTFLRCINHLESVDYPPPPRCALAVDGELVGYPPEGHLHGLARAPGAALIRGAKSA
jgi:hypothetical protein